MGTPESSQLSPRNGTVTWSGLIRFGGILASTVAAAALTFLTFEARVDHKTDIDRIENRLIRIEDKIDRRFPSR